MHVPETVHDSLWVALLALEHTSRLRVRTSMALAFPTSPMVVALAASDLARFSGGRFQLGLATQVRGNVVGRFSLPWSESAARLTDYVRAVRAIFATFAGEGALRYEGSHYRFDRLQPYFNPGALDGPGLKIFTCGGQPAHVPRAPNPTASSRTRPTRTRASCARRYLSLIHI